MLKQTLTSVAMATALVSTAAIAGGPDVAPECMHCFKPFIGVNYSYLSVDTNSFTNPFIVSTVGGTTVTVLGSGRINDSFNGIGFEFGAKYGPYFGMAFGVNHYFEESSNFTVISTTGTTAGTTVLTGLSLNTTADMLYGEARGYWPLMEGFDLIGSVGGDVLGVHQRLNFPATVAGTLAVGAPATAAFSTRDTETLVTWRFGVGLDYYFTPNWGIQAMFHYSPVFGNLTFIEDFWTVDAGIYYMFD